MMESRVELTSQELNRVIHSLDRFMTEMQSMAEEFDKSFIGLVDVAIIVMMDGLGLLDEDDDLLDGIVLIQQDDNGELWRA